MAVDIVPEDAVRKLTDTVGAVFEVRQRFWRNKEQGFLDVYKGARNERTALGTSEFLMCLLLPMDAVAGSPGFKHYFDVPSVLRSEEHKQIILNDIQFIISEITRERGEAADSKPVFGTKTAYIDGKPYAYDDTAVTTGYAESIDAASFFLSTCVLLKRYMPDLLTTRWEGHALSDWVDQIIRACLDFLDARARGDAWGFFESGLDMEPDEASLLFFTWTATEAIVTAAEAGEPAAVELRSSFLIPRTLPEIETRIEELAAADAKKIEEPEKLLPLLYRMTHLLIIASLLGSRSDAIEQVIEHSFEYWRWIREALLSDTEGRLANRYQFGKFKILDIGLYPLYFRSLFLALSRADLGDTLVGKLERQLSEAYYDLLKMAPREPKGKEAQDELAGFAKWRYLGSNAEGGLHFIFLTERVVEAYASLVSYLVSTDSRDEELTIPFTLRAEAIHGLMDSLAARIRADLERRIDDRIDGLRKDLLEEAGGQRTRRRRGTRFSGPTAEQLAQYEELTALSKFLVNPHTGGLLKPKKAPPGARIKKMAAHLDETAGKSFGTQNQIRKEIGALEAFVELWDEETREKATKRLQEKDQDQEDP